MYICRTIFLLQSGALILYLVLSTRIARKDSRPDSVERDIDERPTIEENDLESSEIATNSETDIQSSRKEHSRAFKRKQRNGVIQGSSNQMPFLASGATNFIEKKEPVDTGPVAIYLLSTTDMNVCSLQCRDKNSEDLKVNLIQIQQISLIDEVKQSNNESSTKKYQ
ncbi:uncharacterized protein TNIN_426641 [Trichonephila inaurata madagascariensis]|uniref:Uncharacterized protein n=1 Tax=Trichonephila inaurata madagascariensis TaxID=2747483 RepID=A0A8X6K359_9ARAC|nr:uncharacterized protein TNIN_426641 [Trichonephila inaurata madagascariensis]